MIAASDERIHADVWNGLYTPSAMEEASRQFGQRGFFSDMVRIADLIGLTRLSDAVASQYSEGCFGTWDTKLGAMVVTAAGSSQPVNKSRISKEHLAVVKANGMEPIGLQITGKPYQVPSSESYEMTVMDRVLPCIEIAGEGEVPVVRSKLHGHRGISAYRADSVEYVAMALPYFHYPVSCSTYPQAQGVVDAFSRSQALNNPDDQRQIVFTILPGHGVFIVEKWCHGKAPFQAIWECMDAGHLETSNDIPQAMTMSYVHAADGMMRLQLLARFVASLDADVVALIRPNGGLRSSSYNYLSGDDAITRRNRQQAVIVFPLLLSSLSQDLEYAQIRDAIDHGAPPLFDTLAEFYGAPKLAVRFIAKTPFMMIEENWRSKVGVLIRLMADIQPEFRPRTPIEWERFFRTTEIISKVSRRPINTTGNRLWLRTCSRRRFDMPEGGRSGLLVASRVIDDFFTGLREALRHELWDMRKTGDVESEIASAIAHVNRSVGIEKLAQIGRRWGDAYRLEQQSFLQEKEFVLGLRWAAPLQAPAQFANRMVVPLCTPNDLIREANSMNHCVDTYIGHCLRGDSQIWSLRSHDGGRISTLETRVVRNRNGDFEVHIIQLRTASNCEPSHECIDAAALLIKHLNQSKCDIENNWRWKVTTAKLSQDQRTMIALTKPIISALRITLPQKISLDTLIEISRGIHETEGLPD